MIYLVIGDPAAFNRQSIARLQDHQIPIARSPNVMWDWGQPPEQRGTGMLPTLGLNNGWEVQVDLGTGRVLQTAYRRSDFIESIHDGSFFAGDWTKLGVFLPTGLVVFFLWLSGLWMWWAPFAAKRRRAVTQVASLCRAGATLGLCAPMVSEWLYPLTLYS